MAYNPVSGSAAFRKKLDEIIEKFQRRGILLSVYRTRAGNYAEELAECVRLSGAAGVIAAGGDGTLHAVINILKKFGLDLPVGVIGSGTSNDFATHLELDAEKTVDAVAENKIRAVDLGLVNGREYFVNVASAGFLTAIAHEVEARQKNTLGKVAYYIRGFEEIPKFRAVPLKITADGKIFELECFLFLVLNSGSVAGLRKITDAAKVDDGKLDLVALKKSGARNLIKLAQKILSGKSIEDDENILYLQGKRFEIESGEKLISDLDGEIGDALPLKIETLARSIKFYCS